MISKERIGELGQMLEKVLARYPEADRETVWRILRDLEQTPMERLRRALRLGPYAISRRLPDSK
jgi:hypothetical protein